MSYIFKWSPDEWNAFQTHYNRRLNRLLTDEKLYAKFNTVVDEQIAVVEEAGGDVSRVETKENFREIILRTEFV